MASFIHNLKSIPRGKPIGGTETVTSIRTPNRSIDGSNENCPRYEQTTWRIAWIAIVEWVKKDAHLLPNWWSWIWVQHWFFRWTRDEKNFPLANVVTVFQHEMSCMEAPQGLRLQTSGSLTKFTSKPSSPCPVWCRANHQPYTSRSIVSPWGQC